MSQQEKIEARSAYMQAMLPMKTFKYAPAFRIAMENMLSGKCAIITGASSGIGAATAKKLASLGASVAITYYSAEADAATLVKDITSNGGNAIAIKADITKNEDVQRLFSEVRKAFGTINILVNNASAKPLPMQFQRSEWAAYSEQLDTNIMGSYFCIKEALKDMQALKSGAIVNVASVYTIGVPPQSLAHYVTAKYAIVGMTRALASELGPLGIRVNAVSPGLTNTKMTGHLPDRFKEMVAASTPLKKIASPEEIASVIAFLCTSEAAHITGANIPICGGSQM
jgi:3-oxoacyl-[acyl-carrier protein] reductase